MTFYVYMPVDSTNFEFRLLTIPWDVQQSLGRKNVKPLSCELTTHRLSASSLSVGKRFLRNTKLPTFYALSYVWGDGPPSREITINGKSFFVREALYNGLRALQKRAVSSIRVWVDAICICQDDIAERSAQILLMREIYHAASQVCIWLGGSSEDGRRCFKFINHITNSAQTLDDPEDTEDNRIEEVTKNAVFVPIGAIAQGFESLGQTFIEISDLLSPAGVDSKAKLVLDPDSGFSLNRNKESWDWRPSARSLKEVEDEGDFVEIASIIGKIFIENDWFSRMWVVQEVGVADSIQFRLGGLALDWTDVLSAICYLHFTLNIRVENIHRLTGLETIRVGWNERTRQPLRDLIRECRYRKATDPRDKVYSLLGLMGDRMNDFLAPDYSKSVGHVYSNITRHFIIQSNSLDYILGWQSLGRAADPSWELASWTPDYTLDQELAPAPLVPIDGRKPIYAASGYDHRSGFTFRNDSENIDWKTLSTRGVFLDLVARLSNPGAGNEEFGPRAKRWLSTILASETLFKTSLRSLEPQLSQLASVVSRYSEYFYSSSPSHIEKVEKSPSVSGTYILDGFLQALISGRISKRQRANAEDLYRMLSLQDLIDSSDPEHRKYLDSICNAFQFGMKRRRLAITENGYIGTVPQDAEEGDMICVLYGCSVPVALRRTPSGDSYNLIGECYLHGFMDAEAIAMQIKGQLQEQDFVLV